MEESGASGERPDYPSTSAKPLSTTMPLQGDVYVIENNPSTYIIHLERREGSNDHPGVGFRETKLKNLIARMEREVGHWDALQGTWNSDALFGFAVQAILDHQACPSCLGEDSVMDMVIFRTIFFELLVFFTFTLLTLHFAY